MEFAVLLICIFSQQVNSFVTEDMGSINNAIGTLKEELFKLHLELNSVKDKLDNTIRDNVMLKNRMDLISKENIGIKRTLKYKEKIWKKSIDPHKHFRSSLIDNGIPIKYADTGANTTVTLQDNTTTVTAAITTTKLSNTTTTSTTTATSTTTKPQINTTTQPPPPVTTTTSQAPPITTATTQPPPILSDATIPTTPEPITKVAFSVGLTKTISLDFLQAIPYDMAHLNIGDGYQRDQRSFIVPVSGVYILYFSALNTPGHSAYIEMVQNGMRLAIVNLGPNDYNMGSQIVMKYLSKGHVIWVRNASSAGPTVEGNVHMTYNTFSGLLLYGNLE